MSTRPLISVVDDDESVRESLPDLLKEFGFDAQAFSSAEEFLASDSVSQTSCLLLDVAMPGMTGPDLQRELTIQRQIFPSSLSLHIVMRRCVRVCSRKARLSVCSSHLLRRICWQRSTPHCELFMTSAIPAPKSPIVFVVDDDISVRESLELLIKFAGWQPETFASAEDFLARPRTLTPSCLVLDVSLPDLNGLELQKLIAGDRIDMPIIFITGHGDVPMTVQAMKAGAIEFLMKPFDDEVLLSAIRNAINRSAAVLGDQAELQVLRESYESLTPREQEIMRLVVAGMLNKQIGLKLGISEITVKAHRGKVMQKMKADSLAGLVKIAVRLGLAPAKNPWHSSSNL